MADPAPRDLDDAGFGSITATVPPLVDQSDLVAAAYHEAGHVVAALALGFTVVTATVARGAGVSGRVSHRARHRDGADPRLPALLVSAAGPLAEELSGADCATDPGRLDRAQSADSVRALALEHGVSQAAVCALVDLEVAKLLDAPATWRAVEALAAALVEHGTLVRSEITDAIDDSHQQRASPGGASVARGGYPPERREGGRVSM